MDIRRHINENAIYRVANAGILTVMGLIGLSRFFGIPALTGLHIMTAFIVIAVLAGVNFLKGRTKVLFLSAIVICLCVAAAVVGLQTCLAFLESYIHWIMGDGAFQGNSLTDNEILQEGWIIGNEVLQGKLSLGSGGLQGNWFIGSKVLQESWHTGSEVLQGNLALGNGVLQGNLALGGRILHGIGTPPESWLMGFEVVQTILITSMCYLLQILIERFPVLKTVLASALLIGLLVCLLAEVDLEHRGVVFLLFYIVMAYVEWIQEHWAKAKRSNVKKQIIWITPFLAAYLLLMAVMPAPEKPYDWQWVKDIYGKVRESFVEIAQNITRGGREDFGASLSGFSGEGRIGNGVREDSREIMTLSVQVQNSLATNMYLTGKLCDTFDGRQWQKVYQDDWKDWYMDAMETLYAVSRFDEERYLRDYLYETRVKIRYEYFNTGFIFAPLKTKTIYSGEEDFKLFYENGALRMAKKRGYGTEYEIRYFQLNQGQELFRQLLEAESQGLFGKLSGADMQELPVQLSGAETQEMSRHLSETEQDEALWNDIAKEYGTQTGGRVSLEELQQYRRKIYDNYLNEITLSEEVENYLAEITKEAKTNLEKLKAIENELASYQYTRTPQALPDWVTDESKFLDFFLLESKEGYCTYFATAFALLARAEGFPARYVQGYCVPMQGSKEVIVYSNMAHSWPEVYIDGVGWIPFEPTPGYGGLRYVSWGVRERGESSPAGNQGTGEGFAGETDASWEELNEEQKKAGETKETEEIPIEEKEGKKSESVFLKLLCFGFPAVLAGCAVILALDTMLAVYRYRKLNPEGKFKEEVRWNLQILSWLGLAREEQETLQELKERGNLLPGLPSLAFIENYEKIVYGGKNAGDDMIEETRKERELLLELLKEKRMWVYLYYRMRLHFW